MEGATMRMTTSINGNVPHIAQSAEVVVKDFTEEYRRVAPGELSGSHEFSGVKTLYWYGQLVVHQP